MGEASIFLIFTMLLGGGSGNELLDLVPTDAYWKAKEVDVTPASIMLELNSIKADDTSKAIAIRRLMAIRTLGELKSPDAIPSLKSQLDSKEMFVADYAQRAILAMEGKASARTSGVPPDRMKADLYMLPEHCGVVGQVRLGPGNPIDLKKLMTQPQAVGDANANAGDQAKSAMDDMMNGLINIAEMTGNVRVDGVTMSVADSVGPQSGFVVMYVRGMWDVEAVKSAIQTQLNQTQTAGEVEFMTLGTTAVTVPSNEFFVLISGPNTNTMPLEEVGAAVKSGRGKFESSGDLIKAVDTVDITQPAWAAMIVTDSYRQAPMLNAFDSLTMVARNADGGLKYELKGTGTDADAVKNAVDQLTGMITQARGEIAHEAEQHPAAQPVADLFNSLEIKADGTNATGTGIMKQLTP